MHITIEHNNKSYTMDSQQSVDISIPYHFNGEQPNFYDVDKGNLMPLKTGNQSWSVEHGASCNVPEISMNIHCTGTHTESVGHLLKDPGDIGNVLVDTFLPAILISVDSNNFGDFGESYHCNVEKDEAIISMDAIESKFEKWSSFKPTTLIIRSLPNDEYKKSLRFNDSTPPFFTNDALQYISILGIKHLVVDLPSVDRMSDGGILGNHRIFWCDSQNPHGEVNSESQKTITELAYIPSSVEDGFHFLDIQIPHFVCDAAPSRPLLYKPE